MQEMYNKAFEQITLSETSKYQIRTKIEQAEKIQSKNPYTFTKWISTAVIAAIAVFSALQASSYVSAAAEYIRQIFHFGDGTAVEIIHEEAATMVSYHILQDINNYVCLENGRLYFVFDNNYVDITDKISEDTYFRYEKLLDDGGKSVILVGGTLDSYGWIELLFDENGNYITNRMNVPVPEGAWVDKAMAGENVPTGNPFYDFGIGNEDINN